MPRDATGSANRIDGGVFSENIGPDGSVTGYIAPAGANQNDYNQDYVQDYGKNPTFGVGGADASSGTGQNDVFGGTPSGTEGFGQGGAGVADAGGNHQLLGMMGFGGAQAKDSAASALAGTQAKGGPLSKLGDANKQTPLMASGGSQEQQAAGLSGDSSAGAPVDITDPHGIASIAGESVKTGAKEAATTIKEGEKDLADKVKTSQEQATTGLHEDTSTITGAAKAIANYGGKVALDPNSGILPRVGVGLAAIVLIGLGIWMLGKGQGAAPA